MQLVPGKLHQVQNPQNTLEIDLLKQQKINAVAGIGNPERFFTTLQNLGFEINKHVFPDHHNYEKNDFNFGAEPVIMTEKDAVKCKEFVGDNYWYLPVNAKIDVDFGERLLAKLRTSVEFLGSFTRSGND